MTVAIKQVVENAAAKLKFFMCYWFYDHKRSMDAKPIINV